MKRFPHAFDPTLPTLPALRALLERGRAMPRLPDLVRLRVLARAACAIIDEVDPIESTAWTPSERHRVRGSNPGPRPFSPAS